MGERFVASDPEDPHADQPIVTGGAPAMAAEAAVVLLHGRGATAKGMVATAADFYRHGITLLAPQAAHQNWYPASFDAPREVNEPALSSAVARVGDAVDRAGDVGVPPERTVVLGFSQGGCVAAEFARRHPRRYGGVVVLAGALPGEETPVPGDESGESLDGTPVFLGCSDDDPHVPVERVHETARVFEAMDGDVTEEIYAGAGHAITDGEVEAVQSLLDGLVEGENE